MTIIVYSKLDPIDTFLLKKSIYVLLAIISNVINVLLQNGYFPVSVKRAHIRPIIKKPKLDKIVFTNY